MEIHGLDTNLSPLENVVLCKHLKAKKVFLHTILLGVGGSIYTSHTLNHLEELRLDVQKSHKTALKLRAHSVLYAHKPTLTRRALEKSRCSQGLGLEQVAACLLHFVITLQILTSSSFSLVEETHGSLGQCVSFSLIDVGSGFTAYVVFSCLVFIASLVAF